MASSFPGIDTSHLTAMTDDFGLFQHARFEKPNKSTGYALDDNARALIVALELGEYSLAEKYLGFIKFCQARSGLFHNKITWRKRKRHAADHGDCFGRVVWACGHAMQSKAPKAMKKECKKIFSKAKRFFPLVEDAKTMSLCLLGCVNYYRARASPKKMLRRYINDFGNRIVEKFEANASKAWLWFEHMLSYCNAKIPQALFEAYRVTNNKRFLKTALVSFDFLVKKTFLKKCFVPIGQAGWCRPNGMRALFDQQPIEAATMTEAAVSAYLATGNPKFQKIAKNSFGWFFGNNLTKETVYNPKNGGVFDGIAANTINENQGAESVVSYLIARVELAKALGKTIK
ncbi:MAG: hypothetical protein JW772_03705 [Candidatus Diapherotrites archaeon]|nr:hypothetical protein [Candidatus Diapherotrites archaeon]